MSVAPVVHLQENAHQPCLVVRVGQKRPPELPLWQAYSSLLSLHIVLWFTIYYLPICYYNGSGKLIVLQSDESMLFKAKLTDEQVREIRHSQEPARALAERHGVSHPTILNIRRGRTYKHVAYEPPGPVDGLPHNEYVLIDALTLLRNLPAGYCETVVASFPVHRHTPAHLRYGDGRTEPYSDMTVREHAEWRHEVIEESIRVAGMKGIVLYHCRFNGLYDYANTVRNLVSRLKLRQIITWNHGGRSLVRSGPLLGKALRKTDDVIFMFVGRYWLVPEENIEVADQWGTVWTIPFDPESRRYRSPFPAALAERCIALGTGRVLDTFAGSGTTVLAAMDAGRDWLACDTDRDLKELFDQRRAISDRSGAGTSESDERLER